MDSTGEIVWEGHPGELKETLIEEHLKSVRLKPTFELPKDLKKAQTDLNAGKYASGVKALETYLKKPKNDADARAARDAIDAVNSHGKGKLEDADKLAGQGYYADALGLVTDLERDFKGMEVGNQAKAKRDAWKKDDKAKAEIEASAIVDKASELLRQKKTPEAQALLQRVLQSKKFEGTKARERAQEKLKSA